MNNDYHSFISWEKERAHGQKLCDHLNPPRSRNASEIDKDEQLWIWLEHLKWLAFKKNNGYIK